MQEFLTVKKCFNKQNILVPMMKDYQQQGSKEDEIFKNILKLYIWSLSIVLLFLNFTFSFNTSIAVLYKIRIF